MFNYDDRNKDGELTCEECGETTSVTGSFLDCVQDAKEAGWGFEKDEDTNEWHHTCPGCD